MESNPTVDYKAYVSTVKAKNERIAILENQLAQAKAGWDSCIVDLRKATEICKETEEILAQARSLVQWTLITDENLPKIGDEVLEIWTISGRKSLSFSTYDWNETDKKPYRTSIKAYRRHHNPPQEVLHDKI